MLIPRFGSCHCCRRILLQKGTVPADVLSEPSCYVGCFAWVVAAL